MIFIIILALQYKPQPILNNFMKNPIKIFDSCLRKDKDIMFNSFFIVSKRNYGLLKILV